jgi:type III restriction enzyme
VQAKIGVKTIYDLSATPFFLRGSGWPEGTLFPWVVSDFSLIDAIEAGIVKVPRVPVASNQMTGPLPTYRDLWLRIREHLPKKGRKTEAASGEPKLPVELEGALHSLYSNYEKPYRLWEKQSADYTDLRRLKSKNDSELNLRKSAQSADEMRGPPPVLIVVCNNTNVSKLVFDFIAGWEKQIGEQTIVQAGQLPIFRNDDGNGAWLHRPNTILVDSTQLESGEAMSDDFKKIAGREIDEFKADYRIRFPGRDTDNLTDEDLLREVMNTVGKAGKLGEQVRCVVSVSMLTEGWDANTVTHVLGVRAFGTQLLCEQVVGRALRRRSYAVNKNGHFDPEYAEVYGVPFSFIPCSGATAEPELGSAPTRVRALENRIGCEITFPRLLGYRYDVGDERLSATFTDESCLALSTADLPTKVQLDPIVGESSIHTLDDLKRRRPNEVAFLLAKLTLEKYFRDDDGNDKPWLFPQLLDIAKRWLAECVTLKDNTFPQLLLLIEFAHDAADRIYHAIVHSSQEKSTDYADYTDSIEDNLRKSAKSADRLLPILRPYDTLGSTRYVDFDTSRPVYATRADKCHISHVVADTDSWEQKMAEALEDMPEVVRYVKNHNLGFTIPYTLNGEEHQYIPDFIACIDDGRGPDDLLNLIVEVTGEKKKDKAAKVATARTLWAPAINNHGGFGRWAFIEVADPWDAQNLIRRFH